VLGVKSKQAYKPIIFQIHTCTMLKNIKEKNSWKWCYVQ